MLLEWENAVDRLSSNSKYIVPVLLGRYVEVGTGGQALQKFNAFGGLADKAWPEMTSVTCGSRTIKETMAQLFSIQVTVRTCMPYVTHAHAMVSRFRLHCSC